MGLFLFDPREKVLLRKGQSLALPPKPVETLLVLVEHHGHVIEKAQLLERVWPNTFVEEATLTQNIFMLRKALGDSPNGHEYIETIPRRGYRFIEADVVEVGSQDIEFKILVRRRESPLGEAPGRPGVNALRTEALHPGNTRADANSAHYA